MLIRQIIKTKLKQNLNREKVGDQISSFLSFFDIVNLLSLKKNLDIPEKSKVIQAWQSLYDFDLNRVLNSLNKNEKMETFNKTFKQLYAEDYDIQISKKILLIFKKKYEKTLHIYLNEEKIIIPSEAPANVKGDIAYLD
ncbi:MAG: hypothetical protein KJ566_00895 [Nanoarchaeota archaeon]|nr:hypothetical protein [Nanoarchaeota archaeon]